MRRSTQKDRWGKSSNALWQDSNKLHEVSHEPRPRVPSCAHACARVLQPADPGSSEESRIAGWEMNMMPYDRVSTPGRPPEQETSQSASQADFQQVKFAKLKPSCQIHRSNFPLMTPLKLGLSLNGYPEAEPSDVERRFLLWVGPWVHRALPHRLLRLWSTTLVVFTFGLTETARTAQPHTARLQTRQQRGCHPCCMQ